MERFTLHIPTENNDDDVVAIEDTVTQEKYSNLNDILHLLNTQMEIIQYREDRIADEIVDLIKHYQDLKNKSAGLVMGDAFLDRVNVLQELAVKLGYREFLKNKGVL